MSNVLSSRQFGRYVEVEIRDFKSQTKTIIGNDFEIEFEFFKSLDQVSDDDSGKIKILGLTPDRIKALQDGGGEVILRCKYKYAEEQVLFQAYIARLYAEVSNNTTLTTIECSANLMNYFQTGAVSTERHTTIHDFIKNIGKKLGAEKTKVFLPADVNPSKIVDTQNKLTEFIKEARMNLSLVGNYQEILSDFCNNIGFYTKSEPLPSGGVLLSFFLKDEGASRMLHEISLGYRRVNRSIGEDAATPTLKNDVEFVALKDMQEADPNSLDMVVLSEKTGLLSVKLEYKIATAYADQELFDHEVETRLSTQNGIDQTKRVEESWQKELEKERRAAEKGKVYTPKKSTYRTQIKVNRRYARVKALLNPNVKPQGLIAVPEGVTMLKSTGQVVTVFDETDYQEDELIEVNQDWFTMLRVRSVNFKGNNKRGDWFMEIYGEDTSSGGIIGIDADYIKRTNPEESIIANEDENYDV